MVVVADYNPPDLLILGPGDGVDLADSPLGAQLVIILHEVHDIINLDLRRLLEPLRSRNQFRNITDVPEVKKLLVRFVYFLQELARSLGILDGTSQGSGVEAAMAKKIGSDDFQDGVVVHIPSVAVAEGE